MAGRIDAGVTAEPDLTDAVASGTARILTPVYNAVAPTFIIGAWFTTTAWAKAHPDLLERYVAAITEAGAWANKNQPASAKILEKYTKIESKPGMKRVLVPGQRRSRAHAAGHRRDGQIQSHQSDLPGVGTRRARNSDQRAGFQRAASSSALTERTSEKS